MKKIYSSDQAREEFLKNAQSSKETKPLLKSSVATNDTQDKRSSIMSETNMSDVKPSNVISRSDSFDLKQDTKSSNPKRRHKHRSNSNGNVAGNVGSGIGSPRNLAEPQFDETTNKWIKTSQSNDLNEMNERASAKRQHHHSNYSLKKENDVHITIERDDRKQKIYITEFPDSRVAARLAKTDYI